MFSIVVLKLNYFCLLLPTSQVLLLSAKLSTLSSVLWQGYSHVLCQGNPQHTILNYFDQGRQITKTWSR